MAENDVPFWTGEESTNRRQVISTDILPDDVLLEIFNSYLHDRPYVHYEDVEKAWRSLVHVCRRWRSIVFGSPRHLNLYLVCTEKTRVRDRLDVWPALPLNIWYDSRHFKGSVEFINAAFEHTDRVCVISLTNVSSLDWEMFLAPMQQPFPELKSVEIYSDDGRAVVPDSFLGGTAPRLESLALSRILFPGLPKLLLSATHLVDLRLGNIPHSGYISPNVMVTVLSTSTSLKFLLLEFESPRSCPDRESRRPPPSTRSVLPVLRSFEFKGVNEYLEDLVARIDAPQLDSLSIIFFNDIIFNAPQSMQFIGRTPTSIGLVQAHITLTNHDTRVDLFGQTSGDTNLTVTISCRRLDWRLSSLEHVCTSCIPPLSVLEDLYIHDHPNSQLDWIGGIENGLWLGLLHPFTAVKNLYLTEKVASHIAPALQELIKGRTTDVLPALQNIFLEGLESSEPVEESIGQLVAAAAAQKVSHHPIPISPWTDL